MNKTVHRLLFLLCLFQILAPNRVAAFSSHCSLEGAKVKQWLVEEKIKVIVNGEGPLLQLMVVCPSLKGTGLEWNMSLSVSKSNDCVMEVAMKSKIVTEREANEFKVLTGRKGEQIFSLFMTKEMLEASKISVFQELKSPQDAWNHGPGTYFLIKLKDLFAARTRGEEP